MTAAFHMVDLPHPEYVAAIARAMRLESFALGRFVRERVYRRAGALVQCVAGVKAFVCSDCGAPAAASGELIGAGDSAGPCHARTCPRCARRRSAEAKQWGERLKLHEVPAKWSWKSVTLTGGYNASSDDDLSIAGLRERCDGYKAAWKAIWAWLRSLAPADQRASLCAITSLEIAGTGHVHLHVLFLSPFVPSKAELTAIGRDGWVSPKGHTVGGWSRLGDVAKLEMVTVDHIAEVAKYPMKTPGGAAESWLGGGRAVKRDRQTGRPILDEDGEEIPALVNPTLAARWEIALMGRRVLERYGAARKLPKVRVTEAVKRGDLPVACGGCGACDPWVQIKASVLGWISSCHAYGVPALASPRAIERAATLMERKKRNVRPDERHKRRGRWKNYGFFIIPGGRWLPSTRAWGAELCPAREPEEVAS